MIENIELIGTKEGVDTETESGTLFFSQSLVILGYDDHGNITADGRFSY